MKQEHELTARELVEESKCHYEWIGLAIAAASAAYTAQQQAKARAKQKRASSAANAQQGGGGGASFAPTATQFQQKSGGGSRLGDMFGGEHPGASAPATPASQGLSTGIKPLDVPEAKPQQFSLGATPLDQKPPGDLSAGSSASFQQPEPIETPKPEAQPQQASGADTASQIGGYGQLAMQLYDMYKKSNQGPPPGQRPQMGPMNLQPTANRFGIPR